VTENKHNCPKCLEEIEVTDDKCPKCGENLLTLENAKMLKEAATQTRFTWVVLLLTFIAALIGLLTLMKPDHGNSLEELFILLLSIPYAILTVGLWYSIYALGRTTFIIDLLAKFKQPQVVIDFLDRNWKVDYVKIVSKKIPTNKYGEEREFRKRTVRALAFLTCSVWIILLISKLIACLT